MKTNKMRTALIVALFCAVVGLGLTLIGVFVLGGKPGFYIDRSGIHSFSEDNSNQRVLMEKTKIDKFNSISMDVEYADIEIIPSDDYYLEYALSSNQSPVYSVKNGLLDFSQTQKSSYFNFSFFSFSPDFNRSAVKLYVPENAHFKNIDIKLSSGDISTEANIQTDALSVNSEYGDITGNRLDSNKTDIQMSSGSIKIENFVSDALTLKNEYGDITVKQYTCKNGNITSDSGSTKLGNATFDSLDIRSEYGDVDVESTTDITEYSLNMEVEYGDLTLPGNGKLDSDDTVSYGSEGKSLGEFKVICDSGDVVISQK